MDLMMDLGKGLVREQDNLYSDFAQAKIDRKLGDLRNRCCPRDKGKPVFIDHE